MKERLRLKKPPMQSPAYSPGWGERILGRFVTQRTSERWGKACPACYADLPRLTADGYGAATLIALIGGPDTSKSQLVYSIVDTLQKCGPGLGISVQLVETTDTLNDFKLANTRTIWETRFADYVEGRYPDDGTTLVDGMRPKEGEYARNVVPHNTDVDKLPTPLIIRLQLTYRSMWHILTNPFASFRAVDLVLYDNAGETFADEVKLRQMNGYALASSGIIFLVDPTNISTFRTCMAAPPQPKAHTTSITLIEKIKDFFVTAHRISQEQGLDIPVAITLAKWDLLLEHYEQRNSTAPWSQPADYHRGFDLAEADTISEDITQLLNRANQDGLVVALKHNFPDRHFFAVSALGRSPDSEGKLAGSAVPFRVLDPVLWLLYRTGYLPSAPLPESLTAACKKAPR